MKCIRLAIFTFLCYLSFNSKRNKNIISYSKSPVANPVCTPWNVNRFLRVTYSICEAFIPSRDKFLGYFLIK